MESESSRDGSEGSKSAKASAKRHSNPKEDSSSNDAKPPAGTPHSASTKLTKRTLFPTTPASYSDDDSSHGIGRKKRRKYTSEGREKQPSGGIHLSERQQVLLLKTFAAENSPKASSPALSVASSSQGTYSASSGTDRIHKRNNRGETLLHIAAHRGDTKQMLELIDQGLDVNALDNADWTPLHEACNKGHVEAARILIQHGAFVNAKGDEDITPLHDAAGSGSVELVKLLLEHGADPNARDKTGRYPIDVPGSPTIITEIKSWPTYRALDEMSNLSTKIDADSTNALAEFAAVDSPRLNSAANIVSPVAHSRSSSTYDSAPQTLNEDQEPDQDKTAVAISPSASSSTSTLKQLNDSDCTQREQPPSLQPVSTNDDDSARGRLSVELSEENPPPPLLTPQLPNEASTSAEKSLSKEQSTATAVRSSPPPSLEPAVTNVPSLESIASSPPLVVITESDEISKGSAGETGELLLQVCPPAEQKEKEKDSKTSAESEQSTVEDESQKSASVKQEPTVASSRTRRKITGNFSKEAPVSGGTEDKKSGNSANFRKRIGSVGVISPANKDSSSSNSGESGAKVQPLRKRLITRSEEDADKGGKKKMAQYKEKPSSEQEHAQHAPDPYEFTEEMDDAIEATTHLMSNTPTSSPRSVGGQTSPAKQSAQAGTSQSSPSVSSTKTNGSGTKKPRHRSRRASSPNSNEMKLPPLKIRLNRPNAVTEAGRQSESESSVSSVGGLKAEPEDGDDPNQTEQNSVSVKEEPQQSGSGSEDQKKDQAGNNSSVGNNINVPPRKRKVRGSGTTSPIGMLSVVTNTTGGASPVVSPSSLPTQEQVAQFFTVDKPRLPNHFRQYQAAREWVADRRRQQLAPVQLTSVPRGVGDFLMIRKSYLLAADGGQQVMSGINPSQESQPPQPPTSLAINSGSNQGGNGFASTLPPQQQPSPTLPPSLQALFRSQEDARHRLRTQHRVEQEKLVLSYEQEVLRAYVHRELTAVQAQPLSACAILMERHSAVKAPPEALQLGQTNGATTSATQPPNPVVTSNTTNPEALAQQRASRLSARHQRPRLDDLDEKFTRLVDTLLQRQRHEAAAMRAVQAAEWAWRSEIVAQMAGDNSSSNHGEPSQAAHTATVPLVTVPDSLPIPRLI